MTTQVSLKINGRTVAHEVSPRTHLGDFIREQEKLTGTHLGCEHGVCGACVVLVDDQPVRSCITYAVACEGRSVTTIEGYDKDALMAKLRHAFTHHHALQCGYCTPGMLATARDIVLRLPDANERVVRAELSGNLCRCTGYLGIVEAILSVLRDLKQTPDANIEALRTPKVLQHHLAETTNSQNTELPFQTFSAHETSQAQHNMRGAHAVSSATIQDTPQLTGNGTTILESFDLPFAATTVWAMMIDLPAVARCLPGAFISSIDANRVKGGLSLKFGPMKADFEGIATISIDERAQTATLNGNGQDRLSQSRASAKITYRIESVEHGHSRVHINMLYSLQGPLAQFSRSGMVQDFVRRMMKIFADNIVLSLTDPNQSLTQQPQALRPIALFFEILWDRFRSLFTRSK